MPRSAAGPGGRGGSAAAVELAMRGGPVPGVARDELRAWLGRLVTELAPQARSLGLKLTGDVAMRRLNREHRGKDQTTDVLSFPGGETREGYHLGDVMISVPQARRQAEAAGHGLERELRVLLLHGVLHCLGYDHESDDGTMDKLEKTLRRRWIP